MLVCVVHIAFFDNCWKKAMRENRQINYEKLTKTFLSAQRWIILFFPLHFINEIVIVYFSLGTKVAQRLQNDTSSLLHVLHSRLFVRNYFTLMAMPRCASRLSKLLKQSIYMRIYDRIVDFFHIFFCHPFLRRHGDFSARRILLSFAAAFVRYSWLQWQCSVAMRPPTVVKRHIVCLGCLEWENISLSSISCSNIYVQVNFWRWRCKGGLAL